MRRREFIALVAGAATVWPLAASAQKAPVRIGFLSAGASNTPTAPAIVSEINEGLHENGMTEGRDYVLDVRYAAGRYEQFPDMARDLAKAGGRVILVDYDTILGARAAWARTDPHTSAARSSREVLLDALMVHPNVRLMPRTTATGFYDHHVVALLERKIGRAHV